MCIQKLKVSTGPSKLNTNKIIFNGRFKNIKKKNIRKSDIKQMNKKKGLKSKQIFNQFLNME